MKLKKWEVALVCALLVTLFCGVHANAEQTALSEKLIRLHVVANSDSDEDQALKLQVRDAILKEMQTVLFGCEDKQQAEEIIRGALERLQTLARETVLTAGYGYDVTVTLEQETFPTRVYDTFSLPAGEYTSLRVKIGRAAGQNWWCVLFPPLCTGTALETDAAVMALSPEERSLITMDGTKYVIRFKSIELLGKLKAFLKGL